MYKKIPFLFIIIIAISLSARQKYIPDFNVKSDTTHLYESIRADSAHGFDVLHYDITMNIDDQTEYVDGRVDATIVAEELLTNITFELALLTVDQIMIDGVETTNYTHTGENVVVELNSISAGTEFVLSISYSGHPQLCTVPYPLGMFFTTPGIYTISDPNASRYWWPCYDHPWDKATVDLHITAREDWSVASNGIRTSIVVNDDGTRTHHWDGFNPMTTFLVSLVIRPFVELTDSYGDIPIQNFVSPGIVDDAIEDFSNLPFMMETFSNHYGEYPFEKYGNAVTNFSTYGAMEHQTMTTLSSGMINGNHGYERIIAHELSHQWFGDCLTPLTWKDVWLSEGFATYSEYIYTEAWLGIEAANSYLISQIQNYYKNWAGSTGYVVYDPPYSALFTPATYEKPASVLHMLRLRTGDDVFFEILQTYFATYHNQNVISSEFIEVCEDVSGQDLQQFFQQWIFQPGLPDLDYAWFIDEIAGEIKTFVKTSCSHGTDFFMRVPFEISNDVDYDSLLVDASPDLVETTSSLTIDNYTSVEFDPDSWILCRNVTFHNNEITNVISADEAVILHFSSWNEISIAGYNVFRSDEENGTYEQINDELIDSDSYTDNSVENYNTYYYKVKAVLSGNFMSSLSEAVVAEPIDFPMDMGVLVVDETRDGNGAVSNPTDAEVDDFYQSVIPETYTSYDIAAEGALTLSEVANYSTVVWHDDDYTINNIGNSVDALASFIAAGGNLIISGWKTATAIPEDYRSIFLAGSDYELVQASEFIGAESAIYPNLDLDPEKIHPAFNNSLPFITVFPTTENSLYQFQGNEGSTHQDEFCGIKLSQNGLYILLGFPLYYCQQEQVSQFFQSAWQEIDNLDAEGEVVSPNRFTTKAYPNPFNPNTRIMFNLETSSQVDLEIYNVKGQRVKTLLHNTILPIGRSEVTWNGRDNDGNFVASGIYFYRLNTDKHQTVKKILLMK